MFRIKFSWCYVLSSMVKFGSINYRQRGLGAPTDLQQLLPIYKCLSTEGAAIYVMCCPVGGTVHIKDLSIQKDRSHSDDKRFPSTPVLLW